MKKILILLAFVITAMTNGYAQKVMNGQRATRQTDGLTTAKATNATLSNDPILKDSTLMNLKYSANMKVQKPLTQERLLLLQPKYSSDKLWEIVRAVQMMMDSSHTTADLIQALRANYHVNIQEVTYIMYHAYYERENGKTDATPWAYNMHFEITTAFNVTGVTLERLLKNMDGVTKNYRCDVREVFAYQYFYLKNGTTIEIKKQFFENLAKAGFIPLNIYDLVMQTRTPFYNFEKETDRWELWIAPFFAGMKRAGVASSEVVKTVCRYTNPKFTNSEVISYLQQGGYTTSEIMDGMREYH